MSSCSSVYMFLKSISHTVTCLTVYLFVRLPDYPSTCMPVGSSPCLPVRLPAYLDSRLSACLLVSWPSTCLHSLFCLHSCPPTCFLYVLLHAFCTVRPYLVQYCLTCFPLRSSKCRIVFQLLVPRYTFLWSRRPKFVRISYCTVCQHVVSYCTSTTRPSECLSAFLCISVRCLDTPLP